MIKSVYLHHLKRKTHGVTVAHQILVLFVGVRIPVGLHWILATTYKSSSCFFIFADFRDLVTILVTVILNSIYIEFL